MTTTTRPAVKVGDIVTGTKLGVSTRRLTATVTLVIDDIAVVGLWAYASTFTPGGLYEGCSRGVIALDPATVEARRAGAIGRNVFWPAPNVDSGLVALVRRMNVA